MPRPVTVTVAETRRRATGWEFVHVWVDDATRLAYAKVLPDEKDATAAGFLRRASRLAQEHGDHCRARPLRRMKVKWTLALAGGILRLGAGD